MSHDFRRYDQKLDKKGKTGVCGGGGGNQKLLRKWEKGSKIKRGRKEALVAIYDVSILCLL